VNIKPLNLEPAHRKTASFLGHPSAMGSTYLDGLGGTNLQSYSDLKESEDFRRTSRAHLKHHESLLLWNQTIARLKDKVGK